MLTQSETVGKLFSALVAAQAEMRNPPKDSINPHFKSRFADLATVLDTVKPVLARHKLGVIQMPCEVDGIGPGLATMLIHESGEFVRGVIALRPAKSDPQGVGAAMTYARRYGLQAVLGITADDDDDGNHASKPAQPKQQPALQQAPAQQRKPLHLDDEAFFDMLKATKREWAKVVQWINDKHGGKYSGNVGFYDVTPEHRKIAADAMTGAAK